MSNGTRRQREHAPRPRPETERRPGNTGVSGGWGRCSRIILQQQVGPGPSEGLLSHIKEFELYPEGKE